MPSIILANRKVGSAIVLDAPTVEKGIENLLNHICMGLEDDPDLKSYDTDDLTITHSEKSFHDVMDALKDPEFRRSLFKIPESPAQAHK